MAQDAAAPASPASSGRASSGNESLQEVVVTANKRVERLHDVPISVEVVDGQRLTDQGINQVSDLTNVSPAVNTRGRLAP